MGALVDHIAGVQGRCRFEQQKPAFFLGHRFVLDPARYHDEFALFHPLMRTVAKLHSKTSLNHKEQFIFVFVMMKYEFALDLVELDLLSVELGNDIGLPIFGNFRELLGKVDCLHAQSDSQRTQKVAMKF